MGMPDMTHELKTLPVYWDAVASGEKPFDVRLDDRGFKAGDTLRLLRHENGQTAPSMDGRGQDISRDITYVLRGGQFGIEVGYVVLGLRAAAGPKAAALLLAATERAEKAEAEAAAWTQSAKEFSSGLSYYRNLVVHIGNTIGHESHIAGDGSDMRGVLCAKVPELVQELIGNNERLRAALGNIHSILVAGRGSEGEVILNVGVAIAALQNSWSALSAELKAARIKIAELEDKVDELGEAAQKGEEEWDKDCSRMLRQLADECKIDWSPDGETADALREYVSLTMSECNEIQKGAVTRDARMKRSGAAEALRRAGNMLMGLTSEGSSSYALAHRTGVVESIVLLIREADRLAGAGKDGGDESS